MADPIQIQQNQIGFAQEVAPFAQDVLGQAQALTSYDQNPYQKYTGDQVAQFSPLQQQSYDYAQQMTSAPQLQDATALAGQAGLGGLNAQYTFNPADFNSAYKNATTRDAQGNVTGNSMLNPFLDVQNAAAYRNAGIQNAQNNAQATLGGAFGGGRQAIMSAQNNADLQRNLGQNQFNAYNQAQQQYNTQNQQNAQQQQFGANLGMQGLQTALQGANALGSLGQTQFAQNVGLTGLQNQFGLQQQQQAQNVLNTNYQNFMAEQNDPYKRLGFYSDIVRGAPLMQTGSSVYQASPTAMQNLTSLGLGAYGLNSLFGTGTGTGKAAGGSIKGYASGGSVMSPQFKDYAVSHVDPRQLPMVQQNAQARGDIDTYQSAMEQMAQDAALRRGIAPALPPGVDIVRAAGGGIIAFAAPTKTNNNSLVTDDNEDLPQEINRQDLIGLDAEPMYGEMAAAAQDGQEVSSGDTNMYNRASAAALGTANMINNLKQEGYSPKEINQIIRERFDMETTLAGESPYGALEAHIANSKADQANALREARGVGALKAAAAVLQPGGFMRGLGSAGSAFADVYGQAQQADRKEKRALASMEFNIADAKRKERMGMTKDAIAAATAAQRDKKDAGTAQLNKLKAIGDIQSKVATANRPIRVGGSGGPKPKLGEDTAAMIDQLETIKSNNPNWAEDPKAKLLESKIKARIGLIGVGKEPLNKPSELADTLAAKVTKDATTSWENMNKADQKAWARSQGLDPKYIGTAKDKYIENYKTTTRPAASGGGASTVPALPAGFVPTR
jgi:hypothetical protein